MDLIDVLKSRFDKFPQRHSGLSWDQVAQRLQENPEKIHILQWMEHTGGEPDVVGFYSSTGQFLFFDCSAESPSGRRSLCYDQEALASRKENKPRGSACGLAQELGISLLDETQYRFLQKLGHYDTKTSSWLDTPKAVRDLGGAIFGDYRYGRTFIYHNGAESYYAARGFRTVLKL